MDPCTCCSAHIAQLWELILLQLLSSLGEVSKLISAAGIQSCWKRSQRATLISNIITFIPTDSAQCTRTDTQARLHRQPRLLQVCFGSITPAALKANDEFLKALGFPQKNKSFEVFYSPSEPSAIALWVMRIWRTRPPRSRVHLYCFS